MSHIFPPGLYIQLSIIIIVIYYLFVSFYVHYSCYVLFIFKNKNKSNPNLGFQTCQLVRFSPYFVRESVTNTGVRFFPKNMFFAIFLFIYLFFYIFYIFFQVVLNLWTMLGPFLNRFISFKQMCTNYNFVSKEVKIIIRAGIIIFE